MFTAVRCLPWLAPPLTAATLGLAALGFAGTAAQAPTDEAFLCAGGRTTSAERSARHQGRARAVCDALDEGHWPNIKAVAATGLSAKGAKTFAVDAASAYCPQYVTRAKQHRLRCGDFWTGPHIRTCRSRVTYGVISDFSGQKSYRNYACHSMSGQFFGHRTAAKAEVPVFLAHRPQHGERSHQPGDHPRIAVEHRHATDPPPRSSALVGDTAHDNPDSSAFQNFPAPHRPPDPPTPKPLR